MTILFDGQTSDGQSAAADWAGGTGAFWVSGTFDGATVRLEASPDGGTTWFDIGPEVIMTQKGVGAFQLGPVKLRASLTGAGASTSVTARI